MADESRIARTPFYFIGPRLHREAELAAYIHREHRRGRDLKEILGDRRVAGCGSEALVRAVLGRPSLIRALGRDVTEAIDVRATQLELRNVASDGEAVSGLSYTRSAVERR
jgi:hypothetical protein